MLQKRDLLDVVLPYTENSKVGSFVREYFANFVIGISGMFCVIANLQRHASGEYFFGHLYLVPLRKNRSQIRSLRRDLSNCRHYSDGFQSIRDKALAEGKKLCVCSADVELHRNGKAQIKLDEPKGLGERNADSTLLETLIANQFFYFLKDVSHVHQHHDPKQDAITEVTEIDTSNKHQWIAETQRSLYREVIRYKRFRNEKSLFRAAGILAYAKSFERCHAKDLPMAEKFNTDELEKSLSVSREELQHVDQKKIAELDAMRNWFFALFGFVISASFLTRLSENGGEVNVHKSLIGTTKFVAENPVPVICLLFVASYVSSFLTHRRDPASIDLIRSILRWMQGFRLRWFICANVLLTTVFTLIFYFLLLKQFF